MVQSKIREITIPETLEFAVIRFSLPSLEDPEKAQSVEITVSSPDRDIHRVICEAADSLIERLESVRAEIKSLKKHHSDQ